MRLLFLLLILTVSLSAHAENIIIKFYATWCPPCKQIAPAVKSVSSKLNLELQEIDMDSKTGEALANRLGVDRIPTLVLIKNGTEVCRIVGFLEEQALLEKVQNCFKDVTPSPVSDGSKNKSSVNTSKTQMGNRETTSPTAGSSN